MSTTFFTKVTIKDLLEKILWRTVIAEGLVLVVVSVVDLRLIPCVLRASPADVHLTLFPYISRFSFQLTCHSSAILPHPMPEMTSRPFSNLCLVLQSHFLQTTHPIGHLFSYLSKRRRARLAAMCGSLMWQCTTQHPTCLRRATPCKTDRSFVRLGCDQQHLLRVKAHGHTKLHHPMICFDLSRALLSTTKLPAPLTLIRLFSKKGVRAFQSALVRLGVGRTTIVLSLSMPPQSKINMASRGPSSR